MTQASIGCSCLFNELEMTASPASVEERHQPGKNNYNLTYNWYYFKAVDNLCMYKLKILTLRFNIVC